MNCSKLTLGILAGLVLSGCLRDKIDFNMAEDIRFRPHVEAPLVKARLSLNDLVKRDSSEFLVVDPDNAVRIRYYQEELFKLIPNDFVEIPDQDPESVPVIVGQPPLNFNMSLGTIGGVELGQASFHRGIFGLQLESAAPLADDVQVRVTVNNSDKNGQPVSQVVTLTSGNTSTLDSISLPGAVFDFTNNGQDVNHISLSVEVVNPSAVVLGEQLDLSLQLQNLDLEQTTGYFGNRAIDIPKGSFDFDISGIEEFTNGFYIKEPSIKLITASTIGVGVEAAADIDGINNDGEVVSLDATPQEISAASDTAVHDTSEILFSPGNSNVADFLAALPNKVLYSGKAEVNPGGFTMNNFLHRNSELGVGIEIDLPLELSINNMKLEQDLNDIDIFRENPDQVEELTLIFNTSNGFPFGLNLSVAFLDSVTQDSIHGFELGLLSPATIGSNGEILQRGEFGTPQEVTLNGDVLEKIKRSKKMRFTAILNTGQNGQKVEKFYTHFDLEIKIAARSKLNLKANDQ